MRRYIVFTFGTSWLLWGLLVFMTQANIMKFGQPLFLLLYMLGGNAPAICELWLKKRYDTKNYKAFVKSIFNPKQQLKWYVFIGLFTVLNGFILTMNENGMNEVLAKPFYVVFLLLPMTLFGGGWEEIGWRGFFQPYLEQKYSKFVSTIIVGIVWSFWHLPLWFIEGNPQSQMSFLDFTLVGIGISFLLTILYSETKSVFLCILFHTLLNAVLNVFAISDNLLSSSVLLGVDVVIFVGYYLFFVGSFNKSSLQYRENIG